MLISPVPATPVAPVQSSRPSPVPVQGVASVEPVSPVADANEQLSRSWTRPCTRWTTCAASWPPARPG
jgi:hypothetical protein